MQLYQILECAVVHGCAVLLVGMVHSCNARGVAVIRMLVGVAHCCNARKQPCFQMQAVAQFLVVVVGLRFQLSVE